MSKAIETIREYAGELARMDLSEGYANERFDARCIIAENAAQAVKDFDTLTAQLAAANTELERRAGYDEFVANHIELTNELAAAKAQVAERDETIRRLQPITFDEARALVPCHLVITGWKPIGDKMTTGEVEDALNAARKGAADGK